MNDNGAIIVEITEVRELVVLRAYGSTVRSETDPNPECLGEYRLGGNPQ